MRMINHHPGRVSATLLGLLPFLLIMLIYSLASQERLAENPNDKLLPGLEQMTAAVERMAFQEDRRSGDYLMVQDTTASLARLGMGVGIAALLALVVGILNGVLPLVRANLAPLVSALSMVPPLAISSSIMSAVFPVTSPIRLTALGFSSWPSRRLSTMAIGRLSRLA